MTGKPSSSSGKDARSDRLKKALRANLRRRKEQAKAKTQKPVDSPDKPR